MNLNIKSKLIIYFLLPLIFLFVLIYILISSSLLEYTNDTSRNISLETAEKYSVLVNETLLSDIQLLNTIKVYFENTEINKSKSELFKKILKDLIVNNHDLSSVWVLFEDETNQSQINQYFRVDNKIKFKAKVLANDNFYNEIFQNMKSEPSETGLYSHKVDLQKEESKLSFSLVIPIYKNNEISGIAGFDFNIKELLGNIDLFVDDNEVNLFLAYNNELIDIKVTNYLSNEKDELGKLINKFLHQVQKSFIYKNKTENVDYFVSINPLKFNAKSVNLSLVVLNSTTQFNTIYSKLNARFIILASIGILFFLLIIILVTNRFFKRLDVTSSVLGAMATGTISEIKELNITSNDEISQMNDSVNFINKNLDRTATFIKEIASGNFEYKYEALTEQDNIGNSLIKLRLNLEQAQKNELERKKTDERLNWATLGAAKFSEIIREHSDNLEELAYAIISDLVNYIDANQGGLFVINEDSDHNNHIELLASYAYSRRKMLTKKIPWGVGLVGRCILEKETIFMTKIPEKYLSITSGLGEENPASLLIVPLIFHEEVFGVVELASFKGIEKYKIDLVEQISESIASAISMVKINVRTAELLRETKIKSEQAASQEEEIRQNVEEMQASRDELNTKLEEVNNTFNAVKSVANIAHFDMNGRITDISDNYLKLLKKDRKEIIGKVQGSFSTEAKNIESFNNFWKELKKGNKMEFEQVVNIENDIVRILSVYLPLKNSEGKVYKVISFAKEQ